VFSEQKNLLVQEQNEAAQDQLLLSADQTEVTEIKLQFSASAPKSIKEGTLRSRAPGRIVNEPEP
jgi:hypothetical protein